jgi:hypothetical protein
VADVPSNSIPMIERRRIEAAILKHVYDTLKTSHGVEVAKKTIGDAVPQSSRPGILLQKWAAKHPWRLLSTVKHSGRSEAPTAAMEMPELGFVFWNRLGQEREERDKQIDTLNPYANFLGKFVCGTICVLAMHRRFPWKTDH